MVSSIEHFNILFTGLLTPMFLFGGVFFPFSGLPDWAQVVGWCLPLSHLVAATRDLTLGGGRRVDPRPRRRPPRDPPRGLPLPGPAPAADAAALGPPGRTGAPREASVSPTASTSIVCGGPARPAAARRAASPVDQNRQ